MDHSQLFQAPDPNQPTRQQPEPAKPTPATQKKRTPEGPTLSRPLTPDEQTRFEAAISNRTDTSDRAILRLLLHAGLRASEVVALNAHHIRFDDQEVRVPEGKAPARTVPVSDEATLADLSAAVEARGTSVFARPLFVGTTGERLRVARVLWLVRHVAAEAGLEVRAASLRRTYAARLEREGLEAVEIAARMGWSAAITS